MHQIKRIIELLEEGRGIWETKRLTGLSRNTVRDYVRRIQNSGLAPSQLLALDGDALMLIVQSDLFEQGQSGRKVDTRFHTIEKKPGSL
ncbi:MAG: helix-turn-helix domain-containing protein [Chryseolinea sp.]